MKSTELPQDLAAVQHDRLRHARVLVELGWLRQAETEIAEILDRDPDDLVALSLFAKIKHIRGELSMAVACEAQLHARRPESGELVRMHLESILHLAQDPERGAGEFLAVGQFQLVQKPTAYLALEEAFRLYLARKPADARGVCRRVANKYREKDREIYRLAILAESWIYELIGDLQAAAEILERLGQERGYEIDIDRLTALVGLYERLGTREKLEAAVNICHHLESRGAGRGVLGRLASLHHRLGQEETASSYEIRHLEEYRKSMHRPTFEDVVTVAAEHFLPLERLKRLSFPTTEMGSEPSVRAKAVAEVLQGNTEGGRRLLSGSTDLLDLKYLADFEALDSRGPESTIRLYVRAFRADPGDLHVLGWLLDTEGRKPSPLISRLFTDADLATKALGLLEAATRMDPGDPVHWRRLATFYSLHPRSEAESQAFQERAEAAERAARDRSRAIGRVLAAAMYRFVGRPHGLIHEIWVDREIESSGRGGTLRREDILGRVTDQMRDEVRNTFLAVREYAQSKFPHSARDLLDYNYTFKITKDDEPSGGTSAGLPTAMAFLSTFLQRPIPQDMAFTGIVVTDAHDVINVRPVGDVEHKVDAAYHRNLRMIVVPAGNRAQLEQGSTVPRAVTNEIVRTAWNLDEVIRLVFGEGELI